MPARAIDPDNCGDMTLDSAMHNVEFGTSRDMRRIERVAQSLAMQYRTRSVMGHQ
jgi:hypothetical protein